MKSAIDNNGVLVQVEDSVPVNVVNGTYYLLTPEQEAEETQKNTEWEAGSLARNARQTIRILEGQVTPRRIRESILGTDNGWLANQESLIATERAKL